LLHRLPAPAAASPSIVSGQVTNRLIFWAPRVLGILYAAFLSIFAFAGLTGGHGVSAGVVHFLTQIIPALIVLAVLAIAWRRQPIGAALFLALAIAYVATSWGRFPFSVYVLIAGPMVLMAGLFLLEWRHRQGLTSA
jgi:hypothetical protein